MKIYVKDSKIDGKGIFAKQNFKRGDIVSIIKGLKKFKIIRTRREALAHPNWVGYKNNYWIDPLPPLLYLNHSCNPNCGVKGRVEIVALKNIKSDEEITVDYSTIEAETRWHMDCKCDSSRCRKIIRSIQFLPKKYSDQYLPYIPTFFKRMYLENS